MCVMSMRSVYSAHFSSKFWRSFKSFKSYEGIFNEENLLSRAGERIFSAFSCTLEQVLRLTITQYSKHCGVIVKSKVI